MIDFQSNVVFIIVVLCTREQMISANSQKEDEKELKNQKNTTNCIYELQSNEIQRSIPEQDQERKRNQKNKFINKLKQFEKNSTSQIKTGPYSQPYSAVASLQIGSRKERNKIAARESRDRKKLYVQLMEGKIQRLEAELQDTAKAIEQVRLDIFSAEMRQGHQGKEANHRQMHIIKKMEGLLEDQNKEQRNNQLNICLDSIIYRIGALGKQRKAALSKLYFDLLNFSQPALYRYILWSAIHEKHLFGQVDSNEQEKWCKEIEEITKEVVEDENNQRDLHQIGQKIANHCHHFKQSAKDLVKFRKEIEKKGQVLDNTFNEIRECLNPQQIAKMILFVEKYQFKKEVRLFEEENVEELSRPKKKVKSEEEEYFYF